jgi:hypothetical protein
MPSRDDRNDLQKATYLTARVRAREGWVRTIQANNGWCPVQPRTFPPVTLIITRGGPHAAGRDITAQGLATIRSPTRQYSSELNPLWRNRRGY